MRTDADLASETDLDALEDQDILDYLGAAREYAEGVTGLYLSVRTVEQTFDRFPICSKGLQLSALPWRLLESIEYPTQEDGTLTEVDPAVYAVNDYVQPARIILDYEQAWPDARCVPNAIKVRYVVGYGTIDDTPPDELPLPKDLRSALLLIMAHLYENREDSTALALERLPMGAQELLGLKRENLGV